MIYFLPFPLPGSTCAPRPPYFKFSFFFIFFIYFHFFSFIFIYFHLFFPPLLFKIHISFFPPPSLIPNLHLFHFIPSPVPASTRAPPVLFFFDFFLNFLYFPPPRADAAAGKETGAAKVSKNLTSPPLSAPSRADFKGWRRCGAGARPPPRPSLGGGGWWGPPRAAPGSLWGSGLCPVVPKRLFWGGDFGGVTLWGGGP